MMTDPRDAYRKRYAELKARAAAWAAARGSVSVEANPAELPQDVILHRETIPGGWYCSVLVPRGQTLRLINPSGKSCVSALFWNADDTSERFNHADTVKLQWTAKLTQGRLLFSDMGRVLMSITADTARHHDALVGVSSAATNAAKYGSGGYNDHRNSRDNFLLAAGKLGLSPRDIVGAINFFAGIRTANDGSFEWIDQASKPGAYVDLRAEMNVLAVFSNCPHPLDPSPIYAPQPVEAVLWRSPPPTAQDYCRTATEEAVRGFENTDRLF
jgi:urea carboxylase-associated protein 2